MSSVTFHRQRPAVAAVTGPAARPGPGRLLVGEPSSPGVRVPEHVAQQLDPSQVAQERVHGHHLEEQEDPRHEGQDVSAGEVVQEVLAQARESRVKSTFGVHVCEVGCLMHSERRGHEGAGPGHRLCSYSLQRGESRNGKCLGTFTEIPHPHIVILLHKSIRLARPAWLCG